MSKQPMHPRCSTKMPFSTHKVLLFDTRLPTAVMVPCVLLPPNPCTSCAPLSFTAHLCPCQHLPNHAHTHKAAAVGVQQPSQVPQGRGLCCCDLPQHMHQGRPGQATGAGSGVEQRGGRQARVGAGMGLPVLQHRRIHIQVQGRTQTEMQVLLQTQL